MKILVVFVTTTTVALTMIFAIGGYRINTSPSIDGLLWKIVERKLEIGEIVEVCLPARFIERHNLEEHISKTVSMACGGFLPLLKRIVASEGDHVKMEKDGIHINNELLPNSARLIEPKESMDRQFVLEGHEYLVAGDTADSLDSRYFGQVDEQWITGTARRIF